MVRMTAWDPSAQRFTAMDPLQALPRQLGCSQRFSLGVPSHLTIASDGSRILFIRSRGGIDPTSCLWVLDGRGERLLVDPETLGGEHDVPEPERVRRERVRERSTGIVAFSADQAASSAVFTLGSNLWITTIGGDVRQLPCFAAPFDPRIDPGGERVAYVSEGAIRVLDLSDGTDTLLVSPERPEVAYGLAEHVAAEEMDRQRGYWWSPDGSSLLVARVDNSPVERCWIAEPSTPWIPPRRIFYPAAGTANADVTLWLLGLDGFRQEVLWDRRAFEYLTTADWDRHGPLISVQSRDQRTVQTLAVNPINGETTILWTETDPCWVALVPGTPVRTDSGRLVVVSDVDHTRRLVVDGEPVTGDGLQVREVLATAGEAVWFVASTEPTELHVWCHEQSRGVTRLTDGPGLHRASLGGKTTAVQSFTEDGHRIRVDGPLLGGTSVTCVEEVPVLEPVIQWLTVGPRELRAALIMPRSHEGRTGRLPVLMCPYAGPAVQRVTRARHWYFVEAQWFAEHGFAVVIADGAGTPGRGPAWEREVFGDMLSPVIADQVAALQGVAETSGVLDLDRVAIRGWSYGGLLALACVLRRPDVFHAAVAGAAPVDLLLSDTYCLERYLGHPKQSPDTYTRCSPVHEAAALSRPLLMVHGTVDDNVLVANSLRMSAALLAAGKQHELLLLPTATHMVLDPDTTANLLVHELRFLRRALSSDRSSIKPGVLSEGALRAAGDHRTGPTRAPATDQRLDATPLHHQSVPNAN